MRSGGMLDLKNILGHATMAMTARYAHLSPDHLRDSMAKTERAVAEKNSKEHLRAPEPISLGTKTGTKRGRSSTRDVEVVDSARARRGSSVVEQLIRNQ